MTTIVTAAELARDVEAFLRFKRAMGAPYRRGQWDLESFVSFVARQWGERGEVPLDEAIRRWCERIPGRKAVTLGNEFGPIRQLCLHRRRRDPSSYIPEHALAPVKESTFLPYIFSHDEVRQILAAATAHKGRFIWGAMLRTFVLVLYCTGLRLGEAARLRTVDVDLDRGLLMVQASKGRSRIVPIRADLAAEIRCYVAERQQVLNRRGRDDHGVLFVRLDGSPLPMATGSLAIRRLLRKLGIKPACGRVGARAYELRHAFAVHRLIAWTEEGVDIHAKLPWLSAYMGHQNIIGTEVYLKATPQLLDLASHRFEQHLRRSRRPQ